MRLEQKRGCLLIVPENDADKAYIEDTLGLTSENYTTQVKRVHDIQMGFQQDDKYVLKVGKREEKK